MPIIETERLKMIDFLPEYAFAAVEGREHLEQIFPYAISKQWPNQDYADILPFIARSLEEKPERSKWSGLIVHKEDGLLIGEMGCKGGPNKKGIVDIGYGIVPDYQNKGYTTEMVKALVSWLFTLPGVKMVTADCLHTNEGSKRVLEKSGFKNYKKGKELLYWRMVK
jgi:RimJ/RimL family protein N-acetyltransferase